jgi:hypothetical protein
MSRLPKAPVVNLNTDALIAELIGEYNENTFELIHEIAEKQGEIIEGCSNMAEYKANIEAFIAAR